MKCLVFFSYLKQMNLRTWKTPFYSLYSSLPSNSLPKAHVLRNAHFRRSLSFLREASRSSVAHSVLEFPLMKERGLPSQHLQPFAELAPPFPKRGSLLKQLCSGSPCFLTGCSFWVLCCWSLILIPKYLGVFLVLRLPSSVLTPWVISSCPIARNSISALTPCSYIQPRPVLQALVSICLLSISAWTPVAISDMTETRLCTHPLWKPGPLVVSGLHTCYSQSFVWKND